MQSAIAKPPASGDADSIIKKHDSLVRHLATRFLGSGVALDDLIQEGRLALWTASQTWRADGGASLWTYARKAVFLAMVRYASAHIDERHESLDTEPSTEDQARTLGPEVEVSLLVRECLSVLNEEERVVILAWMEGETFEAIASALAVSDRQVRRVHQNAILALRERASS